MFQPATACVLLLLLSYQCLCQSPTASTICEFPKGMCQCYSELESSLLATESNKINLATAFFPLEENLPEFVIVKYYFNGTNNTDPQIWFWSTVASHFIHPFEVFQFLSLFFSKPEKYYSGSLNITLNAECANLQSTDIKLHLLTQRLKYYAERESSTLVLRDTYSAHAYNKDTLNNWLQKDHYRTTRLVICTTIFIVVSALLIILFIICASRCTKFHNKSKLMKKMKRNPATVHSLAVLSLITNIYILSLACSAIDYWQHHGESELRELFHEIEKGRTLGPLIFILIVDIICLIIWTAIALFCMCKYHIIKNKQFCKDNCSCESVYRRGTCHCKVCYCNSAYESDQAQPDKRRKCEHCDNCTKCRYDYLPFLSLTVLSAIFCIIAHSPYIAIAYLDDGSHASSMFIYYSILSYALFGLLWLFFHWCDNFEDDKQLSNCLPKVIKYYHTITLIFLVLTTFMFLGLVVTITCYFVFIPINKSISDAPNRVVSIYQSGGFIIGSVIVYKILELFYISKKEEVTIKDVYHILQKRLPACPVQQPEKSQKSSEDEESSKDQQQVGGHSVGMPPTHSTQQGEPNLQEVPQQPDTSMPLSDFSEGAGRGSGRTEADQEISSEL